MLTLGLIDSKPSTVALLDGGHNSGHILAALSEERLCRFKMAQGVPRGAIDRVLADAGAQASDVEAIAVGQYVGAWMKDPEPWSSWFETTDSRLFVGTSSILASLLGHLPLARYSHHRLKRWLRRGRLEQLPRLLAEEHGLRASVKFYDHHLCHAASAYYTCDLEPALVITLDGGGDGRSGSVYLGREGRLEPLASIDSYHSLGNLYSYATHLCDFRAERDEGKITGLAALGEPRYAEILRRFITTDSNGLPRYRVPMYHRSALHKLHRALPQNFDRAHLAASVQEVLEEVAVTFTRFWLHRTGLRQLAVAGGVFANVKLNQRLHELPEVDALFVHPAMDDSGLALGAAFIEQTERADDPERLKGRLKNVYLGTTYNDAEIASAVQASGLAARRTADLSGEVAELLANGRVVARFTGRMEYGPRALGHRSILYPTTEPAVNQWLNQRLRRTEFMPFAPATLAEHAAECYEGLSAAADAARFMTATFDCTAEMRSMSPGVVHVDGTARPQVVDQDTAPDFHAILTAYHQRTGIPSLVNTSFNLHGEPIVDSPEDALRSFREGRLDVLAIGDFLVENL